MAGLALYIVHTHIHTYIHTIYTYKDNTIILTIYSIQGNKENIAKRIKAKSVIVMITVINSYIQNVITEII